MINQNRKKFTCVFYLLIFIFFSCQDDIDVGKEIIYLPKNETLNLSYPSYFPKLNDDFSAFPLTKNGVELGQKLFYDGRLSADNTISCSFCHIQKNAFTHHGHSISHGIEGRLGMRNTPSLNNVGFYKNFSWDGAIHQLEEFSIIPITTDFEMNETMENILLKLENDQSYKKLFMNVYGTNQINGRQVLNALSQFMLTMISAKSKYDMVLQKKGAFSEEEQKGYQLFQTNCASCHKGAIQSDFSFRNTGLTYNKRTNDIGRMRVSLDVRDSLSFRVPSLRNVELTAPYMHDGRFRTLEAVLKHYVNNLKPNPNLDPLLRKQDGSIGLSLSEKEQKQIIAFLKTLTDNEFISNKNLEEPLAK